MSGKLHQRPPFRAEHLGSLLRPVELLDIRHKIDKLQGDHASLDKELTAVEDTAVKDIVKTQIDLGFHGISDGEYRRHMFWYAIPLNNPKFYWMRHLWSSELTVF